MDPIIETYKTEGNKYFQNCQYNEAIECYTSALKIDPNHVISLGNRSACYLALSLYYEAEIDAKRAIELDKTYIKGYFRLATALKKSKQFVEASRICTIGLEIDPTNVALKKIKSECNQEQVFSRNIFGNLYKDKNQSKNSKIDGEDNQKYENKSSNNTTTATTTTATSTSSLATTSNQNNNQNNNINNNNGNNRKNNSNNNDNILNGVETRMYEYLLGLISRIQSGEFSSSDANSHMLQGTFRKLVERETFSDTLFPGVPLEVSNSLPKNLRELLEWNGVDRCVAQKILQMTKSAAKILEGVRVRGEARGDIMDAATETVLIPQIAQETFAREIVDIVRNLSKRASNLNARLNLSIASPQAPQASLDQLDDHIFEYLANEKSIAVQDTFLGEDWAALVLNDIIRYTKTEKMTDMSFFPHVSTLPRYGDESTNELSTSYIPNLTSSSSLNSSTINNNNNNSNTSINSTIMNDKVRIAWIESKETAAMYPALSEAIRNLHSLPYEINAKTNTALSLLEPARGFTMLTHVPKNCNQPPRFDNHIGENDSGLRLSCLYLLVPPGEEGESSVAAQYILKTNNNNDDMKIDVIQDRLILYRSLEVKNSRTAAVRDYYQLCFYIHGRYGT